MRVPIATVQVLVGLHCTRMSNSQPVLDGGRPPGRYPGVRIIVADDEYVGVAVEEFRRLSGILTGMNVTYLQLLPR